MRYLEELNNNSWPGLRWSLVDGWIVRFGNGFTRRANSVLPLYPGTLPLEERIVRCEALQVRAGLPPCFKIFPETEPAGLDGVLDQRGYGKVGPGSTRTLEGLSAAPPRLPEGVRASGSPRPTEAWLACYADGRARGPGQVATALGIMEHIVPAWSCVLLETDAGPAACALVAVEEGWAGVSAVAVKAELRGRGLGRCVMAQAHAQAAALGARRAYLTVMDDNPVAGHLYQTLGYRIAYPTWTRVKQTPAGAPGPGGSPRPCATPGGW
jgi:GNAT superfamily N-acetyltransferase